jgi:hypothetical protein
MPFVTKVTIGALSLNDPTTSPRQNEDKAGDEAQRGDDDGPYRAVGCNIFACAAFTS